MLEAAKKGAEEGSIDSDNPAPILLGVTVLTSMTEDDMQAIGLKGDVENKVLEFARLAKNAGLVGERSAPDQRRSWERFCRGDDRRAADVGGSGRPEKDPDPQAGQVRRSGLHRCRQTYYRSRQTPGSGKKNSRGIAVKNKEQPCRKTLAL